MPKVNTIKLQTLRLLVCENDIPKRIAANDLPVYIYMRLGEDFDSIAEAADILYHDNPSTFDDDFKHKVGEKIYELKKLFGLV